MIHRSTNAVNVRSSAWFRSDTAQYFISPRVQERTLYPGRVTMDGDASRLSGAGVMNRLTGICFVDKQAQLRSCRRGSRGGRQLRENRLPINL
jgi:hypothetical protein